MTRRCDDELLRSSRIRRHGLPTTGIRLACELGPEPAAASMASSGACMSISRSRLAMPRIVSMPDAQSVRTANRLLDMVHGGALLSPPARCRAATRCPRTGVGGVRRRVSGCSEYDRPIAPTDVGLTYATPTLMSVVDLDVAPRDRRTAKRIILQRSDVRSADRARCFGSRAVLATKAAMGPGRETIVSVLRQASAALRDRDIPEVRPAAFAQDPPWPPSGRRSATIHPPRMQRGRRPSRGADSQEIVLYPRTEGLAVHNMEYRPNSIPRPLHHHRSPVNPVILPYRSSSPSWCQDRGATSS